MFLMYFPLIISYLIFQRYINAKHFQSILSVISIQVNILYIQPGNEAVYDHQMSLAMNTDD